MSEKRATSSRRGFFGAVGAGVAAAAVATKVKNEAPAVASTTTLDAAPKPDGYQVTQHVKDYYTSAAV
jgi:hypothetical protein